jgi:hypothetical protein
MSNLSQFFSGGKLKIQEFTSSGTWTRPSGVNFVLLNMVGGGGSGRIRKFNASSVASASFSEGGGGGKAIVNTPVEVNGNVSVTVGAGGAAPTQISSTVTVSNNGNDGGDSLFGSVVASRGMRGANIVALHTILTSTTFWHYGGFQWDNIYNFAGGDTFVLQNSPGNYSLYRNGLSKAGTGNSNRFDSDTLGAEIYAGGGGAGLFGRGGEAVTSSNNATVPAVPVANSGAGSGGALVMSTFSRVVTGRAGSGGRVQVIWVEL